MQEGKCTSEMLGGKCSEGRLEWKLAKRPTTIAFAVLTLASLLPNQSTGQVSSQAPTAQTQVRHALSPEILAMHARLKRPRPPSVRDLTWSASAASSPANFNSEQGPGPGPRAGLPGCDVFPAPASVGADSRTVVLWTTPFHGQPEFGRAGSVAQFGQGGRHQRNNHPAFVLGPHEGQRARTCGTS